jgi:hypothetical protein
MGEREEKRGRGAINGEREDEEVRGEREEKRGRGAVNGKTRR